MTNQEKLDQIEEQLASPIVRECREGLDLAEELLAAGEDREAVTRILQDAAEHHRYVTIRDAAARLLESYQPPPPRRLFSDADRAHIFGVQCPKCGHVTYFDKQRVCREAVVLRRRVRDDQPDELLLKCEQCGEPMIAAVDCGGDQ